MIKIMEDDESNEIIMHCLECDAIKGIKTDDAKSAYLKINEFRKVHEHLKEEAAE